MLPVVDHIAAHQEVKPGIRQQVIPLRDDKAVGLFQVIIGIGLQHLPGQQPFLIQMVHLGYIAGDAKGAGTLPQAEVVQRAVQPARDHLPPGGFLVGQLKRCAHQQRHALLQLPVFFI